MFDPKTFVFAFLFLAVALVACGGSTSVCSPGMSVACVGPGGCASGQACNADGTGYEVCACGTPADAGTDAGTPDSGATSDAGVDASLPTHGALHVTWTLTTGSGAPTTCAAVPGAGQVSVLITPSGSPTGTESRFACDAGQGDVPGLAFGAYSVAVSLLDGTGAALGTAPAQTPTLASSPCDAVVGSDCVKNLPVTISTP